MPSPFPGMDPYLEGSAWSTVHMQMIAEISRQLTPKLRPKYVAMAERRFVLDARDADEGLTISEASAREIIADLGVVSTGAGRQGTGGTAVAAPLTIPNAMPSRIPQHMIEIRDVVRRRLVTDIEILSPANKRGIGRKAYVTRRRRLLFSSTHLLEIDLLRLGKRVPLEERLPDAPWFIFLSRAGRRPMADIWPVSFDEPLPEIPVPLLGGDDDVMLDLQQAFTNVYDSAGLDLVVDYTRPAETPLPNDRVEWARARIEQASRNQKNMNARTP